MEIIEAVGVIQDAKKALDAAERAVSKIVVSRKMTAAEKNTAARELLTETSVAVSAQLATVTYPAE